MDLMPNSFKFRLHLHPHYYYQNIIITIKEINQRFIILTKKPFVLMFLFLVETIFASTTELFESKEIHGSTPKQMMLRIFHLNLIFEFCIKQLFLVRAKGVVFLCSTSDLETS